jgi:hypothetical protein
MGPPDARRFTCLSRRHLEDGQTLIAVRSGTQEINRHEVRQPQEGHPACRAIDQHLLTCFQAASFTQSLQRRRGPGHARGLLERQLLGFRATIFAGMIRYSANAPATA